MEKRKDVLKPFAVKRAYMEDRIQSGIEANRKGYAALFCYSGGTPVPGVRVRAVQKTHEFKHGANLFMLDEFQRPEQNERYKKDFASAFNLATLPFYWCDLEPEQGKPRYAKDSPKVYRRPAPDLCLEFCEEHGIEPKAHCLNYESFAPAWVAHDAFTQRKFLEKRFRELSERYAARIPMWEVLNEVMSPVIGNECYNRPDFLPWNFKLAEQYFPANKLILNEATRLWGAPHWNGPHSTYYLLAENAMLKGARIDAVGMQFHMFYRAEEELLRTAEYYDPERIYAVMDTFSNLNRPLQITEVTIPAYGETEEDESIQLEIVKNLYSMWFSHPAMEGVIYWNLIDGFANGAKQGDMASGENYYRGGLLRYDFTPKPAFEWIRNQFGKVWRTTAGAEADDSGIARFKGFYGDYEIEAVTPDGRVSHHTIEFRKNSGHDFLLKV